MYQFSLYIETPKQVTAAAKSVCNVLTAYETQGFRYTEKFGHASSQFQPASASLYNIFQ